MRKCTSLGQTLKLLTEDRLALLPLENRFLWNSRNHGSQSCPDIPGCCTRQSVPDSIKFLPSGDPQIDPILVKVGPTAAGYEFMPMTDGRSPAIEPKKRETNNDAEPEAPISP